MTEEITMIISGVIIAVISGMFMASMKRSWAKKATENNKGTIIIKIFIKEIKKWCSRCVNNSI